MLWKNAVLELISIKEEKDPDIVTLVVGDENKAQSFFLHKTLLKLSSVRFKTILSQNGNSYQISGVAPNIFEEIVKHIYMFSDWEFNGNLIDACNLLKATLEFELEELTHDIYKTISGLSLEEMGLTCDNACFVYDVIRTTAHLDRGKLKFEILRYICKSTKILTLDSFFNLSHDALIEIIGSDFLEVYSELDVFKAVIGWGMNTLEKNSKNFSHQNLQETLKMALDFVRVSKMSTFEIESYVVKMGFHLDFDDHHDEADLENASHCVLPAESSSPNQIESLEAPEEGHRKSVEPTVEDILQAELYVSNFKSQVEASIWKSMLSELKDETRQALTSYESSLNEVQKMSAEIAALRKEVDLNAIREEANKMAADSAKMAVLRCEWQSLIRDSMHLILDPNDDVLVVLQNSTDLPLIQPCVDEPTISCSEMPQRIAAGERVQFSFRKRNKLDSIIMFSYGILLHDVVVGVNNYYEDEFAIGFFFHTKNVTLNLTNSTWKSEMYNKLLSEFWNYSDTETTSNKNKKGLVSTKEFQHWSASITNIRASMKDGILRILIFQC